MRKGLLTDLEEICNLAIAQCGCMPPDECDETREMVEKVQNEIRMELGNRPLMPSLRKAREESKGVRRAIIRTDTTEREVHGEEGIYMSRVHVVTLECGHTKRYTGRVRPKLWTRCHECLKD